MPAEKTPPPKVNLFDGTGILGENDGSVPGQLDDDLGYEDEISEAVGRLGGYLGNYAAVECVLPSDDGEDGQPAVFDRCYFPADGGEPVLVDLVPGGSDLERAEQEADRHVAFKRDWCKQRGVTYKVVVGSTW